MDRQKKLRRPVRAAVTKTIKDVEDILNSDLPDIGLLQIRMEKLQTNWNSVQKHDETIMNLMVDANVPDVDVDLEAAEMESYDDKVREIIFKAQAILGTSRPPSSPQSHSEGTTDNINKKKTYQLPEIQMKKFNGDLSEWLAFWSQFKKIHEDEEIHDADKFQYLMQSIVPGSRAESLVNSYPQCAENYPLVINALEERFGKKKLLKQYYVRQLLQMTWKNIASDQKLSLSQLYDQLHSHLRSLGTLGVSSENMAELLYPMVESSMPEETLKAWQRSPLYGVDGTALHPPKSELNFLMDFLKQEVESEEQRKLAMGGFAASNKRTTYSKKSSKPDVSTEEHDYPTAASLYTGSLDACYFCGGNHDPLRCIKADRFTLDERKQKVKEGGGCSRCLRKRHKFKCKGLIFCLICKRDHHGVMCPELPLRKLPQTNRSLPTIEEPDQDDANTVNTALNCIGTVMLQTLVVRIEAERRSLTARLILDSGSQKSYIKTSAVKALNCKPIGHEKLRKALFGGAITEEKLHYKFQLNVKSLENGNMMRMTLLEENTLCGNVPKLTNGPWQVEITKNKIKLTDFSSIGSTDIELLIGSDYYGKCLTGNVVQLSCGLTAVETIFGWTMSGQLEENNDSTIASYIVTTLFNNIITIEDLWNLDTLGIKEEPGCKTKLEREQLAKIHFLNTVTRNPNGRYAVALPWIEKSPNIPSNYSIAEKRLKTATSKLISANMWKTYDKVFQDWLAEGIIEEVPVSETFRNCHYLPHRPVFKPESTTTPVRPVFDASCKCGRSPSLNECLEKGPNLMELIPAVLMRFRLNRIGVISDIRKAFQMIEIVPSDRDFLRFLWWSNNSCDNLIVYRHRRVVFGVNCSPFLLAAVLEHHLKGITDQRACIAQHLLKSLYVDNCVTSVSSPNEYDKFKTYSTELLSEALMELRQWEFTSYDHTDVENESQVTSVLGMQWNKREDMLNCIVQKLEIPVKLTKRYLLSQTQKIFDPIGFLSPAVLPLKLMIQQAWERKVNWDDELEPTIAAEYMQWWSEIDSLQQVKIPRNFTHGELSTERFQIHSFGDASCHAMSAVVYLRVQHDGFVSVQLLQGRSRVAPINKHTIPRLELMAALLTARLTSAVVNALELADILITYWTDSANVLAWIKRNDNWGTFVGNRVREIILHSDPNCWRHVPGHLNPADLPSRGCKPSFLLHSKWWEGPHWLKSPPSEWPNAECLPDEVIICGEKRKTTVTAVASVQDRPWYVHYSRYSSNVRLIAWIRRFIFNLRHPEKERKRNELHVMEINEAEEALFRLVQTEVFGTSNYASIYGIRVLLENGLFRVKTKLLYRDDSENFVKPILLPNRHPLVDLLIIEEHKLNQHAGIQYLLGRLRERVWILQGRRAIKRVVGGCVICKRFTTKSTAVPDAPLPADRVKDTRVFEATGVDLAGPLFLKGRNKAWIVIFTCAVYRCVHLELVTSLSTDAFLLALQRFISRRGRPATIYSDNGTNFIGANNVFRNLNWTRITTETKVHRIQWKFNPPSAAWWGGWWERLIRSVKDLLKRVLGHGKLDFEGMHTCLCETESIINGRPLTYITEDDDDLIALKPSMFIMDLHNSEFPETDALDGTGLRRAYNNLKIMKAELRTRFRKEYLSLLIHPGKGKSVYTFAVGDIVHIGSDNKKRLEWPLGKIIELFPGKDGELRVAKVKTSTGIYVRPLQRLYPLEVRSINELPSVNQAVMEKAKACENHVEYPEDIKTRFGRRVKKPIRF